MLQKPSNRGTSEYTAGGVCNPAIVQSTEERLDMENELAKEKKQVSKNFVWASIFLWSLFFAAMGILFYMMMPNLQISPISPGTEKLLLLGGSILLLAALCVWGFWYRLAFKKYKEEYWEELQMFEKSKRGRVSKVLVFFLTLLGVVIGWYFYRIFG